MASSYLEPIPPTLVELLSLLEERLPDLQFPEADGRSVYDVAAEVRAAAAEARRLDEAAERAYRALADRQRQLMQKAARAVRYARIYADARASDRADPVDRADMSGLARALDAITLPVDDETRSSLPPMPVKQAKKKPAKKPLSSSV